jgi:FtsP/CotA-like multicopper oxidase with cupredoxin domain
MYHSHHDEMTQMALGMTGMFVIHPRRARPAVDRDFVLMLHEWRVDPGARRPDPRDGSSSTCSPSTQGVPRHRAAGGEARASACASGSAT